MGGRGRGYVVAVRCTWDEYVITGRWHVHWVLNIEPGTISELPDDYGCPGELMSIGTCVEPETHMNASPEAELAAAKRIMTEMFGTVEAREIAGRTVVVALEPVIEEEANEKVRAAEKPDAPSPKSGRELADPSSALDSGCVLLVITVICWFVACIAGAIDG